VLECPLAGISGLTSQHRNTCISSLTALVQIRQSGEDILLVDTELSGLLQRTREYVQKDFAIGLRVDVAMGLEIEILSQLVCVDQVAILLQYNKSASVTCHVAKQDQLSTNMGKANSVRSVNVEGLRLGVPGRTGRRVSHYRWLVSSRIYSLQRVQHTMTDSHVPRQIQQLLLSPNHLRTQPVSLA
jgi:hypothetical protein